MADLLSGSVNTPLGTYPKRTVFFASGFVIVLAGIVYYRSRNGTASGEGDGTVPDSAINPATGFPFGSAEDAAAMAAQGAYINPAQPYAPGGGSLGEFPTNVPGSFLNNAQWSQYVIDYFDTNGLVENTSQLSSAIGKYLSGQSIAKGSSEESLVNQAIAIGGKPPIAGANGYPPSINTNNSTTNGTADTTPLVSKYGATKAFKYGTGHTWTQLLNEVYPAVTQRTAQGQAGARYKLSSYNPLRTTPGSDVVKPGSVTFPAKL